MHTIARAYSLPDLLVQNINSALEEYSLNITSSVHAKKIADSILHLSDFFISNPRGHTPWKESWAQIAYTAYYLPLNYLRLSAVFKEAQDVNFFNHLEQMIDFGAGPGTATLAIQKYWEPKQVEYVEIAEQAFKKFEGHFQDSINSKINWHRSFSSQRLQHKEKTLGVFSYSLTEEITLPEWAFELEALAIIEPSTQEDGRKVLELRKELLERNFEIWAPCTHQGPCPLLVQSKRDWCHDRIHFVAPDWFLEVERYLPIKNNTLTMSYLLARKKSTLHPKPAFPPSIARVIGDTMKEKGKDRQMICRGQEREFLAWLHKNTETQEIPRGSLIELPDDLEKKSNEIRINKKIKNLITDPL